MQPKFKRPSRGNVYGITVRQHVHAAHLIRKFNGNDDKVSVVMFTKNNTRRVTSTDAVFCAYRAWDEKAEHVTCDLIEQRYFAILNKVLTTDKIEFESHEAITEYYCLWNVRHLLSIKPQVDMKIKGQYLPSCIRTEVQRELLEKKGYVTTTNDGTVEARFLNSVHLRQNIDMEAQKMRNVKWGLLTAPAGVEFICSDAYPDFAFMPISPSRALIGTGENVGLTFEGVASLNRMSKNNARTFYFARDLSMAPILKSNFI